MKTNELELLLSVVLFIGTANVLHGATMFSDNFDPSLPMSLTNATVPGWITTDGTVDYIKQNNPWGINCLGNMGGCIDLDGSTWNAAIFSTEQLFTFRAGSTYILSFYLSGSQRSGSDTVQVSFGGMEWSTALQWNDPFNLYSLVLKPDVEMSGSISFHNLGADNVGAILDSVSLEEITPTAADIPEPPASFVVSTGILILAFWKWTQGISRRI